MKQHFCGRRAVLEGNLQLLEREELDQYILQLPQFYRNIEDILELVMPTGKGGKCPHSTDGVIAYKLL
jgi:hypothetical protein